MLNNYNQSFDSLNVGEYGCIDIIIKQVILKLIPKVSDIIEGIAYVVKELKKRMCRLPINSYGEDDDSDYYSGESIHYEPGHGVN